MESAGPPVPITTAARVLATTPRMLRYRERAGLLPPGRSAPGEHRRYGERELQAARTAQQLEAAHGVGPSELAFALRVLAEPALADALGELGRLAGRLPTGGRAPLDALDFDAAKGRRLLGP